MIGFVNVTNTAMNDRVCECDGLCNDSDRLCNDQFVIDFAMVRFVNVTDCAMIRFVNVTDCAMIRYVNVTDYVMIVTDCTMISL